MQINTSKRLESMVAESIDLLERGSTMPHRGIVLPLLALFLHVCFSCFSCFSSCVAIFSCCFIGYCPLLRYLHHHHHRPHPLSNKDKPLPPGHHITSALQLAVYDSSVVGSFMLSFRSSSASWGSLSSMQST